MNRPVIAVIGAGFSGVLTALHLLTAAPGAQVRIIERADRAGRGRAYATTNPRHLLNVRARNMSAFTDAPDHFVDWLAQAGQGSEGEAFVSRGLYGDYLQGLLRERLANAEADSLLLEQDEAVAVRPSADGRLQILLALGRTLVVDAVVLAIGAVAADARAQDPLLDPWGADLSEVGGGDILLLGSGLTAVDAALSLDRPDRRIVMLSRRGLAPQAHGPAPPAEGSEGDQSGPRQALRSLRRHAAAVGWRSAVDALRPQLPQVWRSWTLTDRQRFLRHLLPWWDVRRHRMAPVTAGVFALAVAEGRWSVEAGRLEGAERDGTGLVAAIRPRGARETRLRRFAACFDCTGFGGDPARSAVVRSLLDAGWAERDPLGLGLALDDRFRLIGADGARRRLYAVGPLARGAVWEATAVPDLRSHAESVAKAVADDLARTLHMRGGLTSLPR